jgi:hypothetical protein
MGAVVLLGAGASKEAGVPMAHEMTERILGQMDGEDRRALRCVCDRLSSDRSELDVETVFAAVELLGEREQLEVAPFVEKWRGEVLRWDCDFYVRLARRMVAEMRNSIVLTYKKVSYLSPLVRWAADPEQGTIATLNYDRAIEVAGAEMGLNVHTGIEGWVQTGRWRWPSAPGLRLLKLHGSIDWVWQDDPPGRGRLPSRVVVQTGVSVDEARPPTLVFGARGKLRAEGPFLAALTEFERQLERADRLIVIGYSFRDDHVNQVIRRWTFEGQNRRIVVVDPGFPEHCSADGAPTFQDQLLLHLNSPEDHLGTRLEVRRSGAEAALPALFPLHP